MYCGNCGTENKNRDRFCKNCEARLNSEKQVGSAQTNKRKPSSPAALKKCNVITICIVAAILLIGTVGGYAAYSNTGSRLVKKQLSLCEKHLSELNYEAAFEAFTKVIGVETKNLDAYVGPADAFM